MKKIIVISIFIALPVSTNARIRLYSRTKEEKRVADSLRVIDSLRIVDSIRVADSIMIARYKKADATLIKERTQKVEREREEAEAQVLSPLGGLTSHTTKRALGGSVACPVAGYGAGDFQQQVLVAQHSDDLAFLHHR